MIVVFCLQKINSIVTSSLVILLNCAQCEANHTALYNLRVINDLLQFTKASDPQIKSVSTLATCFLVNEENAHLVVTSAESGVMRYLLKKFETASYNMGDRAGVALSITELLRGLMSMALSDMNKTILVYDGILPILSRVLVNRNLEEKLLATDLIWSLTFQEDNKYYIQGEHALMEALHDLSENGEDGLKVKVKGVLCQLEITRDRIRRVLEAQPPQGSYEGDKGMSPKRYSHDSMLN